VIFLRCRHIKVYKFLSAELPHFYRKLSPRAKNVVRSPGSEFTTTEVQRNNDYCAFHFRRLLSKGFSILYSGVKFVLAITFSEPRKLPLDLLRGHGLKLVSLQGLGTSIDWKQVAALYTWNGRDLSRRRNPNFFSS
jgi:hypothetical protein